jgi:hypothetical protein
MSTGQTAPTYFSASAPVIRAALRGSPSNSLEVSFRRNPLLRRGGKSWPDYHRASLATVFGSDEIIVGIRLQEEAVPNVVYFLHQAPTTSVPLNPPGVRGWKGLWNPL